MKPAILFAAVAATALSLAACQKPADKAADAVASSEPVNAAQDATSAAVGATSATTAAVANSTDAFVTGLATGGMYEIKAGEIAEKKAKDPAVKALAKMMVSDHTALGKAAEPAIKASGKPVPTELDERRKGLIDNLNAAAPGEFDAAYLSQQEAAHSEALTLLRGYADGGGDAGLKAVAVSAIPKVQMHLDKLHELQSKR